MMPKLCFRDLADIYCTRQLQNYYGLQRDLREKVDQYRPDGFMLLECVQFDSNYFGNYTILPYGPRNTYHEVPTRPISPRGMASDMSRIIATMDAAELELDTAPYVETLVNVLVESQVNRMVQGKTLESYDRQLAIEALCQRWADEIRKPVVLMLREESGQVTFKPRKKSKNEPNYQGAMASKR